MTLSDAVLQAAAKRLDRGGTTSICTSRSSYKSTLGIHLYPLSGGRSAVDSNSCAVGSNSCTHRSSTDEEDIGSKLIDSCRGDSASGPRGYPELPPKAEAAISGTISGSGSTPRPAGAARAFNLELAPPWLQSSLPLIHSDDVDRRREGLSKLRQALSGVCVVVCVCVHLAETCDCAPPFDLPAGMTSIHARLLRVSESP